MPRALAEQLPTPTRLVSAIVLVCALAGALIATVIVVRADLQWVWADGRSRVVIARSVFDNRQPGFAQFGNAWLPLQPALMIPTVWNDWMYRTGASGIIVSLASLVATAFYAHRLVYLLTASRAGAFVAMATVLGSINFLFLSVSPMSEVPFAGFSMAGWYYWARWARARGQGDLSLSALFLAASAMIRYEGWFSLITGFIGVIVISYPGLARSRDNAARLEGELVAFSSLLGFPMFLFVLYNWIVFHSPLGFLTGSREATAVQNVATEFAVKGQLVRSVTLYSWTALDNFGPFPIALAVAGIVVFAITARRVGLLIPLLLTGSAAAFYVVSLFGGGSGIHNPRFTPGADYFNVRYGIAIMPIVAVGVGVFAAYGRLATLAALGGIALQAALLVSSGPIVNVRDATQGDYRTYQDLGARFDELYDGGPVLVAFIDHAEAMPAMHQPLSTFIHEGVNLRTPSYQDARQNPARWVRWVITRDNGTGKLDISLRGLLARDFDEVAAARGKSLVERIYRVRPEAEERERLRTPVGLSPQR